MTQVFFCLSILPVLHWPWTKAGSSSGTMAISGNPTDMLTYSHTSGEKVKTSSPIFGVLELTGFSWLLRSDLIVKFSEILQLVVKHSCY